MYVEGQKCDDDDYLCREVKSGKTKKMKSDVIQGQDTWRWRFSTIYVNGTRHSKIILEEEYDLEIYEGG